MLLARLGLRSCEVAGLELDDIEWRAGELRVRGKGRGEDRLPLLSEVGEALATDLLRQGAALPHISQVLRHPDLATTAANAKVDLVALGSVAQPWPGGERCAGSSTRPTTTCGRGRALGHNLEMAHRLLPDLVADLDAVGAATVTIDAALAWAQRPEADPATSVWARRMTVARGFARHMAGVDPRTEIPPVGLVTFRQRWRPPFIDSAADITALLSAARRTIPTPMRTATVQTLVGLLAATGMRVGEAIRFERDDLDTAEGLIIVRQSKFGKSRLVPLQASTLDALCAYAEQRDRRLLRPKRPTFFISTAGTRLLDADFCKTFRRLVQATGVGAGAPHRPRIHDLRHSVAVHTLVGWYRAGEDVGALLPRLATYLGHRDPCSTYWYLLAAPELLALAAGRLEAAPQAQP